MNGKIKKLPESELEIMLILWDANEPVPRSYIDDKLKGRKDWAITTVLNFLSRLIEKGFVTCRRQGKMNIYEPAVSKEEYLSAENKSFLSKLYNNSLSSFVASLYFSKEIGDDELEELHKFIESTKGGDVDD